jgi:hypothetical protein
LLHVKKCAWGLAGLASVHRHAHPCRLIHIFIPGVTKRPCWWHDVARMQWHGAKLEQCAAAIFADFSAAAVSLLLPYAAAVISLSPCRQSLLSQ